MPSPTRNFFRAVSRPSADTPGMDTPAPAHRAAGEILVAPEPEARRGCSGPRWRLRPAAPQLRPPGQVLGPEERCHPDGHETIPKHGRDCIGHRLDGPLVPL